MRETLNFDHGWLFHRGDIDSPLPNTHIAAYMNHKAGWARGAARANFDDSDWPTVDLPHDWSIDGPFNPANHLSAGFLPRGIGWYRRHFALNESDRGRRLTITFDGVATHCTVYVNGHLLHRHFCGYTPSTIDITDVAHFGEQLNVIAVRVDATYMEGWWYEGAGIYRHVWLEKTPRLHIISDEVAFVPAFKGGESWIVKIEVPVRNDTRDMSDEIECVAELFDDTGNRVAETHAHFDVEPGQQIDLSLDVIVDAPRLWSPDSPVLYTARTRLLVPDSNDLVFLDEVHTSIGFRTVVFDAHHGFFLNGQPLKLLGTCNHQDHAGLGVALPDAVHEFRIRKLKEAGCNAYRCSHHPPAKGLLDACDRLGMLVMDENRAFGSSPEHLSQLRSMVLRDRNHPSVILWSICNEESIQTSPVSKSIAQTMVAEVKRLDPTRPVTAAVSGGVLNDGCIGDALDVMCINYQLPLHDAYHEKFPNRPLIAGETHCVVSTRGVYQTDETQCHLAADDTVKHPWGETARNTWRHVSARPYVAGLFVWTGFDYRGEPYPGRWPCVNSQMGFLDACGFEKDSFYLHKAWWTDQPFVHVMPHWTHPGRESETIAVKAYTNADEAELFLNDRSLGRRSVDPIEMAHWNVVYEPGVLHAVAYRGGSIVAQCSVATAGQPASIRLHAVAQTFLSVSPRLTDSTSKSIELETQTPLRQAQSSGMSVPLVHCGNAVAINVSVIDAANVQVPTSSALIQIQIAGPAVLLGVGNGDPKSHERDRAPHRALFNGLAQLIIQTTREPGEITITATAAGLQTATLTLHSIAPEHLPPIVPVTQRRHWLTDWRISPVTPDRPDPAATIAAADMNSWVRFTLTPAGGAAVPQAGYVLARTTFTPPKAMQSAGGRLRLVLRAEKAELYLDGRAVPLQTDHSSAALFATIPAGGAKIELTLLAKTNQPGELFAGPVELLP